MRYEVRERDGRLEVEIAAPQSVQDRFLHLLEACTQGERACPALRCGSIETRAPAAPGDPILVTLTPHPGVRIDPAVIETCLAFTLGAGKRCAGCG